MRQTCISEHSVCIKDEAVQVCVGSNRSEQSTVLDFWAPEMPGKVAEGLWVVHESKGIRIHNRTSNTAEKNSCSAYVKEGII